MKYRLLSLVAAVSIGLSGCAYMPKTQDQLEAERLAEENKWLRETLNSSVGSKRYVQPRSAAEQSAVMKKTRRLVDKWQVSEAAGMLTAQYEDVGLFCSYNTGFRMLSLELDKLVVDATSYVPALRHKTVLTGETLVVDIAQYGRFEFKNPLITKYQSKYATDRFQYGVAVNNKGMSDADSRQLGWMMSLILAKTSTVHITFGGRTFSSQVKRLTPGRIANHCFN